MKKTFFAALAVVFMLLSAPAAMAGEQGQSAAIGMAEAATQMATTEAKPPLWVVHRLTSFLENDNEYRLTALIAAKRQFPEAEPIIRETFLVVMKDTANPQAALWERTKLRSIVIISIGGEEDVVISIEDGKVVR